MGPTTIGFKLWLVIIAEIVPPLPFSALINLNVLIPSGGINPSLLIKLLERKNPLRGGAKLIKIEGKFTLLTINFIIRLEI